MTKVIIILDVLANTFHANGELDLDPGGILQNGCCKAVPEEVKGFAIYGSWQSQTAYPNNKGNKGSPQKI